MTGYTTHGPQLCGEHHDLVVDFGGIKPPIVVLCGSTQFYKTFAEVNLARTLQGWIVLSIGCDTKSDGDLAAIDGLGVDPDMVKRNLDRLHRRKIDLADEVLVLNVGGYIGESTRGEIQYAEKIGKPVRYLDHARYLMDSPDAEEVS
jgi:hypothetical protein